MLCTLLVASAALPLLEISAQEVKTQPAAKRQILAVGGGGLGKAGTTPPIMKYFLELTGKPKPRVCYMPTAVGDQQTAIDRWYAVMKTMDCEPHHQKVFIASGKTKSFEEELLKADAIYVGGGNTLNMVAIWKAQGIDKILRKAWEKGTVLGGESAGSICWFEYGSTDSRPAELSHMECLGFLKGSNCPHYDGEKKRRPSFQDWIQTGQIKEGIACDNGVAAHFVDDKLFKVVSTRPNAKAYVVKRGGDKVVEEALQPEMLTK
jgi:dipeptidase E